MRCAARTGTPKRYRSWDWTLRFFAERAVSNAASKPLPTVPPEMLTSTSLVEPSFELSDGSKLGMTALACQKRIVSSMSLAREKNLFIFERRPALAKEQY